MGKLHNKMPSNYVRLCVMESAQTPANNAGMPAVDRYNIFLYRLPVQRPPGMRCFRQPQPSEVTLPSTVPNGGFYSPPERPEVTLPSTVHNGGESRGLGWILDSNNMQGIYDPTAL